MSNAKTAQTATIQLDTVLEGLTFAEWAQQLWENFAVEARMVQENGPAGGNPLIEYTGTNAALDRMRAEYFDEG